MPRYEPRDPPDSLTEAIGLGGFGPQLRPGAGASEPLSIAVLPFTDLGGAQDDEFLVDGLVDDLIADLSRIREAKVIARSTTFAFKGRPADARQVGRDLAVRYVVEGSVRRRRDAVRVNVALVETETGVQRWTDRLDVPIADWNDLGDALTGRIARALNLEVMEAASRSQSARGTPGSQAWAHALTGWVELFNKPQTPQTNERALAAMHRAVALDPDLALAWTGLAYGTLRAAMFGWDAMGRDAGMARARELAARAVQLDPSSADANYVLGGALLRSGDLAAAINANDRCLALNRNYAPALARSGLLAALAGQAESGIAPILRAMELSPRETLRAVWLGYLGTTALALGDFARTRDAAREAIAENAAFPVAHLLLAMSCAQLHATEEARAAVTACSRLWPAESIATQRASYAFAAPRFRERWDACLEALAAFGFPRI